MPLITVFALLIPEVITETMAEIAPRITAVIAFQIDCCTCHIAFTALAMKSNAFLIQGHATLEIRRGVGLSCVLVGSPPPFDVVGELLTNWSRVCGQPSRL